MHVNSYKFMLIGVNQEMMVSMTPFSAMLLLARLLVT